MNRITLDHDADYSRSFHLLRPVITDHAGVKYIDFIKTLKPNYLRVYLDIALGYTALICSCLFLIYSTSLGLPFWLIVPTGAILIGFWVAYLQLFIHEGAHWNLHSDRAYSDLLCNTLIAWMVGTSVQQYRAVHFQHHRALGQVDDSEITYFFPLNLAFLFRGLFGIRVLEVLTSRRSLQSRNEKPREKEGAITGYIGVAVHLLIVSAGFLLGAPWFSVAWIIGVGAIFPFFGALRQLLEHRDEAALPEVDYTSRNHGAFTRLFESGVFSSLFGGAGFNRHLLHHWEPQISYTNLPQLEAYLRQTEIRSIMDIRRTTYLRTFIKLFN
jgi:fatty acid desaturase